jgi:peroxiredoxin
MRLIFAAILLFGGSICAMGIKPGKYIWQIERSDGEKIVFMMNAIDQGRKMYLINGSDSVLVTDIRQLNDSFHIELPFYESSFTVKPQNDHNLKGFWIKKSGGVEVSRMPVTALYGVSNKFYASRKPLFNVTGEWSTVFRSRNKDHIAAGEFVQKGNHLSGTFRTPYGDYRFLDGVVSGDSIYLSGFDGSMSLLFKGKITKGNIDGYMYSRNADPLSWHSDKGKVELSEDLTKVIPGSGKLNFTFPDTNGKMVSINDARYKNKVVVLQIMGSWCPNCFDEMKFIKENYSRYQAMGVEFIALAYERTDDFNESKKALTPFLDAFQVPYPVLITPVSVADEDKTSKTLPQIDDLVAFPTTIFVDKSGNIAKIHTGFDGPATGAHYLKYKEEFENTLKNLTEQ